MNSRGPCRLRRLFARAARDQSGQELAEGAIILPFLLILGLGVVEFGSIFGTSHTLTSLGREGANIASRGAPLDTVNALMLENGAELQLAERGGAISSRIVVEDSVAMIRDQAVTGEYAGHSRLGMLNQPALGLETLAGAEGATFMVVEMFYVHEQKTPLRSLVRAVVPDTLYARAIF